MPRKKKKNNIVIGIDTLEVEIQASILLRIEFVYSVRGLKQANTGRTLKEFLTANSINRLLECYKRDYKT